MKSNKNSNRYFKKHDSPHVLTYNPNFVDNDNFVELPADFDLEAYQKHMKETKGKPTRLPEDFCGSKARLQKEEIFDVAEDVENIQETVENPVMEDIEIEEIVDEVDKKVDKEVDVKAYVKADIEEKPKPTTRTRKTTKRGRPRKNSN